MVALRQDGLADETVGPNITWLDLLVRKNTRGLNLAVVKFTAVQVT
jgi:hypothetical protein